MCEWNSCVRYLFVRWKYFDRESEIMFCLTIIWFEYSDDYDLIIFQTNHLANLL